MSGLRPRVELDPSSPEQDSYCLETIYARDNGLKAQGTKHITASIVHNPFSDEAGLYSDQSGSSLIVNTVSSIALCINSVLTNVSDAKKIFESRSPSSLGHSSLDDEISIFDLMNDIPGFPLPPPGVPTPMYTAPISPPPNTPPPPLPSGYMAARIMRGTRDGDPDYAGLEVYSPATGNKISFQLKT